MDIEQGMKNLGRVQEQILLWLSEEEGVVTREQILERWPREREVPNPQYRSRDLSGFLTMTHQLAESMRHLGLSGEPTHIVEDAPHARYLEDTFLARMKPPGVSWSAKRFLGRGKDRSKSATLSKSLGDLEKRGFLTRHKAVGKHKRTSHVSITPEGAVVAFLLRQRRN